MSLNFDPTPRFFRAGAAASHAKHVKEQAQQRRTARTEMRRKNAVDRLERPRFVERSESTNRPPHATNHHTAIVDATHLPNLTNEDGLLDEPRCTPDRGIPSQRGHEGQGDVDGDTENNGTIRTEALSQVATTAALAHQLDEGGVTNPD